MVVMGLAQIPRRLRRGASFYAAIVLSQFHARGHRRIGVVSRDPNEDEYFSSKINALRQIGASLKMRVEDSDFFISSSNLVDFKEEIEKLKGFLEDRGDLDALLLLASNSIIPIAKLMGTSMRERLSSMSIVLNVLDGVKIPKLPSGDSLATITPPLEELGKRLGNRLLDGIAGKQVSFDDPLIPHFRPGDSLKFVNA